MFIHTETKDVVETNIIDWWLGAVLPSTPFHTNQPPNHKQHSQGAGDEEGKKGEATSDEKGGSSGAKGFLLLDQYGLNTAKVTGLHEEAREFVFAHILEILKTGKSAVAGKREGGK